MAKVHVLTDSDLAYIKDFIKNSKARRGVIVNRPYVEEQEIQAPDVYIARTPLTGIPALEAAVGTGTGTGAEAGDHPGFADCELYRVLGQDGDNPYIENLGLPLRRIFNLSKTAVPGGTWVTVVRDKPGQWIAVGAGTGTGTVYVPANCTLASLQHNDCIRALASDEQEVILTQRSDDDIVPYWESYDEMTILARTGIAAFWFADGVMHLSIADMELVYCGDSCWRAGGLTGHTIPLGTGGVLEENGGVCDGDTVEVCLSCVECPSAVTLCCEGNPLPYIVHATFTNYGTGGCTCANVASIPLVYNGTDGWEGTGPFGTCGYDITIQVRCLSGPSWYLGVSFSNSCYTIAILDGSPNLLLTCEPLSATYTILRHLIEACPGCAAGGYSTTDGITITITE